MHVMLINGSKNNTQMRNKSTRSVTINVFCCHSLFCGPCSCNFEFSKIPTILSYNNITLRSVSGTKHARQLSFLLSCGPCAVYMRQLSHWLSEWERERVLSFFFLFFIFWFGLFLSPTGFYIILLANQRWYWAMAFYILHPPFFFWPFLSLSLLSFPSCLLLYWLLIIVPHFLFPIRNLGCSSERKRVLPWTLSTFFLVSHSHPDSFLLVHDVFGFVTRFINLILGYPFVVG